MPLPNRYKTQVSHNCLGFGGKDPIDVILDRTGRFPGGVHVQVTRHRVGIVVDRRNGRDDVRPAGMAGNRDHAVHQVGWNITKTVVADGVGVLAHFVDDAFRRRQQQGVGGKQSGVILVAQADDRLQEINVGAGIGLTREPHNGPVVAADLGPVVDLATVDIGNLLEGQLTNRVLGIDDNGNGIPGDHKLDRRNPVCLRLPYFIGCHGTRGIGDVHRPVDEGGNPGSGSAASYRKAYGGMLGLVTFRPGQGQVDHRVGAFILDVGGCLGWGGWLTGALSAGGQK